MKMVQESAESTSITIIAINCSKSTQPMSGDGIPSSCSVVLLLDAADTQEAGSHQGEAPSEPCMVCQTVMHYSTLLIA